MKRLMLIACLLMVFQPAIVLSDVGTPNASEGFMAEIEKQILARDFEGAKETAEASLSRDDWKLSTGIDDVIAYFEALETFRSFVSAPGKTSEAIAAYEPLVNCYNHLPDPLPFSQFMAGFIEGSILKSEKYVEKTCGDDYRSIKVGMKFSRVQQCYGSEIFLRGQVKTKDGVVDKYGRGGVWLYVKKGRVIAWGE